MPHVHLEVFTESGPWVKHPRLYAIELVARAPGGGGSWPAGTGNGHGGGAGGVSRTAHRISARDLPDTVEVTIGAPGAGGNATTRAGGDGGTVTFGDFMRVEGGTGASTTAPGIGGLGIYRGGNGGYAGQPGESKPLRTGDFLAAPGGGAGGGGYTGGGSGDVPAGRSAPILWQTTRSGGGGNSGQPGGFPGGGGGGGTAPSTPAGQGAWGAITVIEYRYDEE